MYQFTAEQIEAAALAQYERREANRAARMGVGYFRVPFEGEERTFLLANAKSELERDRDREWQVQAVILSMAHMTDADIQYWIDRLSAEHAVPNYRIMVDSWEYQKSSETLSTYENEKLRRTLAALKAEHDEGRIGDTPIFIARAPDNLLQAVG